MEELLYLISIGFSGTDLWRALWIGLLGSLIASRKFRAWKVGFFAFLLDRIWPFVGMHFHDYELNVIMAAAWNTFLSVPQDITFYIVRYLGILGLVYLGYNLRRMLHAQSMPKPKDKHGAKRPNLLPY